MTLEEKKEAVQKVLDIEGAGGDERFAELILAYCNMVLWDDKAIQPILDNESAFMSDLENMGSLKFYIINAVITELRNIAKSNDKETVAKTDRKGDSFDPLLKDWTEEEVKVLTKKITERGINLDEPLS